MDHVGLLRTAIMDEGDIAHQNCGAVDDLDRQIVQRSDRIGRVVEPHRILRGADLDEAGRVDLVLRGDGGSDILRRKPLRLQRLRV